MRFLESITRATAINNSSPGVVQYTDAPKSDVPVKRNILPRGAIVGVSTLFPMADPLFHPRPDLEVAACPG